jgi:hypothetical protein
MTACCTGQDAGTLRTCKARIGSARPVASSSASSSASFRSLKPKCCRVWIVNGSEGKIAPCASSSTGVVAHRCSPCVVAFLKQQEATQGHVDSAVVAGNSQLLFLAARKFGHDASALAQGRYQCVDVDVRCERAFLKKVLENRSSPFKC